MNEGTPQGESLGRRVAAGLLLMLVAAVVVAGLARPSSNSMWSNHGVKPLADLIVGPAVDRYPERIPTIVNCKIVGVRVSNPMFADIPLASWLHGVWNVSYALIVLALALIQAVAVTRVCRDLPLLPAWGVCIVANLVLSPGEPVQWANPWPMLLFDALTAILLQFALFSWLGVRRGMRRLQRFGAVAAGNAAVYGLLALVFVGLLCVPPMFTQDRDVLKQVSGTLVAYDSDFQFTNMRTGSRHEFGEWRQICTKLVPCGDGGAVGIRSDGTLFRLSSAADGTDDIRLPAEVSGVFAVSGDARLVACTVKGTRVVYDLRARKVLATLPKQFSRMRVAHFSQDGRFLAGEGDYIWLFDIRGGALQKLGDGDGLSFSTTGSQLAWLEYEFHRRPPCTIRITIYDCTTGRRRSFVPPEYPNGSFAWSPDGRYFAYYGRQFDPVVRRMGRLDLMVMTTDGKRVAAVSRDCLSSSYVWLR